MCHQNRAGAPALEDIPDFVAQLTAQFAIEVGKRFVQQQELWLWRQGPGQCDPLLLAARQFVGEALAQVLEIDQLQHLGGDPFFVRVLANAEGDVVGHAQVRKQGIVLEHHADPAFLRGEGKTGAGDGFTRQLDFPFVNRLEACNRPQGRGLAATG
ncbi:hypothetical protein D3C78_1057170 [compost metagenome]